MLLYWGVQLSYYETRYYYYACIEWTFWLQVQYEFQVRKWSLLQRDFQIKEIGQGASAEQLLHIRLSWAPCTWNSSPLTQMSTIQKPAFGLVVLTAFGNSREPVLRCSSSHLLFKPDQIKCVLLVSVAYEQFRWIPHSWGALNRLNSFPSIQRYSQHEIRIGMWGWEPWLLLFKFAP